MMFFKHFDQPFWRPVLPMPLLPFLRSRLPLRYLPRDRLLLREEEDDDEVGTGGGCGFRAVEEDDAVADDDDADVEGLEPEGGELNKNWQIESLY
jgi:hypothetical protein